MSDMTGMTGEQTPGHVAGEVLSAYVDGELAGADRDNVEAHLETCTACRAVVLDYLNTGALVSGLAVHKVPEQLRRNLLERLPATNPERQDHPAA